MDPDTGLVNGIAPKKLLEVNQVEEVAGSGKDPYKLKRLADHYSCSCPAWRFKKDAGILSRTCKHLKALLGEEYEDARVKAASGSPSTSPKSSPTKKRAAGSSSGSPSKKSKNEVNLMLAENFEMNGKVNPEGWWMSEKLDGVRAYWDGSSMWSRSQNRYDAPDWFTKDFPDDIQLDGELWTERDAFDHTSGIIRAGASDKWERMIYMVFDTVGDTRPVEQRWKTLEDRFGKPLDPTEALARKTASSGSSSSSSSSSSTGKIVVLKQEKCKSHEHLVAELEKIEKVGGEGLMLRKAASQYEHTRSRSLLKVKTFYDAEAEVIRIEQGAGKNAGRMGALRCRMENGSNFKVGTGFKDSDRDNPPPVGTIIKYKFQELSQEGTPRFPVYMGIAIDKTEPKDATVRSTKLRADKKAAAAATANAAIAAEGVNGAEEGSKTTKTRAKRK